MRSSRSRHVVAVAMLLSLTLSGCSASGRSPHKHDNESQAVHQPGRHRLPNIVFVLTDDLSMNLVGQMPHVRQMQRAGTTMSKFYVIDSLCCPSRAAIFTGQYPHNNGVFTNHGSDGGYHTYDRRGDERKSFALALQRAGYRTALFGKYLNEYDPHDRAAPGWNEWDVTGSGYREYDYLLNHNNTIRAFGNDPQSYLTDVLSARAAAFVDSTAGTGRPFFLEVATFAPHNPYIPPPRYLHALSALRNPRTAAYNHAVSNAPRWLRNHPPLTRAQQDYLDGVYRQRARADLAVDDLIANLQRTLRARGLAKDTYFVFSSDNGYHLGEYGLAPGKQTAFDTDINVPLIVTGPGVPAGRTVDRLASNVDLAPTFLALGRAQPTGAVDGVSLAPLWHGAHPPAWQQAVLVEHHGPPTGRADPDLQTFTSGRPPSYEAIRTADALYVRYADGEQEYYDTATDPAQLHNLGPSPVPPALRAALTALRGCRGTVQCQRAAQLTH